MIVLKMVGLCLLLFGGIKQQIYQLFLIVPLGGVTYTHTQLCNHHCPPSPQLYLTKQTLDLLNTNSPAPWQPSFCF